MPRKAPSIVRIQTAELAIQQILDADLPTDTRTLLEAAKAAVTALRPHINPADHTPIYVTIAGGARVVGCTCGETPTTRAARMSMSMAFYHSHIARIGVPRTNLYPR